MYTPEVEAWFNEAAIRVLNEIQMTVTPSAPIAVRAVLKPSRVDREIVDRIVKILTDDFIAESLSAAILTN